MIPWYIATRPFSPADGESWEKYIAWSKLTQLTELVSLDGLLCRRVLKEIKPSYWPHIVNEDFLLDFFIDLEFMLKEIEGPANVLCVFREPAAQPEAPEGAEFLGYDLIDRCGDISALSNCGGFPGVFDNSELNHVGLLDALPRANEVRDTLRAKYPDEHHAVCNVWAIFRLAQKTNF